jgi:hypothetical protein
MLVAGLSGYIVYADGFTNNSTNQIKKIGDYTMMRGTNGYYIYVNPSEFWNGVWKEDTNGWRTQLRIYTETNYWVPQERVMYPVSTNLMLRVEWGSTVKNSGGGYYLTPNGKFTQFQLLDAKGNVIPPNSNAGTNLLGSASSYYDQKLIYRTDLPAWASPSSGSLVANFPMLISTNLYPHLLDGDMAGKTWSSTNLPPLQYISLLKLDEIYSVTNEGDYTLTVQPVLYKKRIETNLLDRVDLPSVTTKVHLVRNVK